MELLKSNAVSGNFGLVNRFQSTRTQSLKLCEPLCTEDYVVQPASEVSPPKWHLAHTTWFFEEFFLKKNFREYKEYAPHFNLLFNSYYKSHGEFWPQAARGQLSRPTVAEILSYRHYVDEQVVSKLSELKTLTPELQSIVTVGIEHEKQHQELLLMDIKAILARNLPAPAYSSGQLQIIQTPSKYYRTYDAGMYSIGASENAFSYDNERPFHPRYVENFEISTSLVSNGDFLEFIEDGGYRQPLLWLSQGWDWVQKNNVRLPLYWHKKNDTYMEFTLYGSHLLALNAPACHISYFEAQAFAKWAGQRLPREDEAEIFLNDAGTESTDAFYTEAYHPSNCNASIGQVWFWTQSAYSPYPGYKAFEGVLEEYNGKFMCNQYVLKGGCFATPSDHYRNSYRNFYEPHQRWMFSGLRLAKDLKG